MPGHKAIVTHRLAALAASGAGARRREARGEEPALVAGVLQEGEVLRRLPLVHALHGEAAVAAAEKDVDCLGGLAAVAHLVAGVQLAKGLLQQRHPDFLRVLAARVEQFPVLVHREVVVDQHIGPLTVDVHTDAVDAHIDIVMDKKPPHGRPVMGSDGTHGPEQEAGTDLALHDVSSLDAALEEHRLLLRFLLRLRTSTSEAAEERAHRRPLGGGGGAGDDLGEALEARWRGHRAVITWRLLVHVEHRAGILYHIPVWIRPLNPFLLAFLHDPIHCHCAMLFRDSLTSTRADHRRNHFKLLNSCDKLVPLACLPHRLEYAALDARHQDCALQDELPRLLRGNASTIGFPHDFVVHGPHSTLSLSWIRRIEL
mmetsp:Transcript_107508/g.342770  ORF Transcript_107508/g.342770 Transcript_107508/m.342770 type:complete len:371 (+) Transcript_107508:965-2077(+)